MGEFRKTEISRRCKFHPDNEFIKCSPRNRNCEKCGWNEEVKKERIARFKNGHEV